MKRYTAKQISSRRKRAAGRRPRRYFKIKLQRRERSYLHNVVDFEDAAAGSFYYRLGRSHVEIACGKKKAFIKWLEQNISDPSSEARPKDYPHLHAMIKKAKSAPCQVKR